MILHNIEIRRKLQSGSTIQQVCQEYQITFPQLLYEMSRLKPDNTEPKKNRVKYCKTDKKYISKYKTRNSEHYVISHGRKYFGTFKTLDDALKVRDWFMVNRWDKRWLDRACKETGVVRCKRLSMNRRV